MWRQIRAAGLHRDKSRQFLLCISGGADSVALFSLFKDFPLNLEVFHAHHGPGQNKAFRDQAQELVSKLCAKHKIFLHLVRSTRELKSENDFRRFRLQELSKWKADHSKGIIVMAHHADDLLETRLIRLIRGTGPQGLRSMSSYRAPIFRPFLTLSSKEIRNYLTSAHIDWCEDPTNQDSRYLRNWIRNCWLPCLERRRPGSVLRLAQSLEALVPEEVALPLKIKTFKLSEYRLYDSKRQIHRIAQVLQSQGIKDFTQGQLKEIQRYLDKPETRYTFKVAGVVWLVNAGRVMFEKAESDS